MVYNVSVGGVIIITLFNTQLMKKCKHIRRLIPKAWSFAVH